MSVFTTEVRYICEHEAGLDSSRGYASVEDILDASHSKVFDFDYPIYDENYRPVLEKKILKHFYTREICEETVGLWKLRLDARMNEIMPYFNKMYEVELIKYNPLYNVDLRNDRDVTLDNIHADNITDDDTTTRKGNEKVSTSGSDVNITDGEDVNRTTGSDVYRTDGEDVTTMGGTVETETGGEDVSTAGGSDTTDTEKNDLNNEWKLYSDTPQGGINGIQDAEDDPSLATNGYLTNATHTFGDTTGSTGSSTTDYGRTDTTEYGRTETETLDRTNTTEYGKVDTSEYGKVDTTEYGKTDTTNYGKISDLERNTVDNYAGTRKSNGSFKNTTDYADYVYGYRDVHPSVSLKLFRDNLVNIDLMIIDRLKDLFFTLWE